MRRIHLMIVLSVLLAFTAACTNKKSVNPLAGVGSKQPDKVLFDKAMDAMRHNRFDVARLTLQTLINTYPDSEYIARAKLAVGDSWYAEGGTVALAQAEQEYTDFTIFFPNMPEAAEAQLKIANIHYQQMEKSDRDPTHAKRAEDEYRKLILQYPDSKLLPDAKKKLMEVQEVLAEREFGVGRFYYLRESYVASIARLQSLVDKYPLYSRADEAYFLLGQNYEGQIDRLHKAATCDVHMLPRGCMKEADKAHAISELSKKAAAPYSTILTRYPLADRAEDAKKRLAALHEPVPRPTKAAVAQNKAEIESRGQKTMLGQMKGLIKKGPDVSQAATTGEPPLVDPEPISATKISQDEAKAFIQATNSGGKEVGAEIINSNQPANAPPPVDPNPNPNPFGTPPAATPPGAAATANTNDPNELKPGQPADPNELTPTNTGTDTSLPPPTQVNEIQNQSSSSGTAKADDSTPATDEEISSSKKKKKKGLSKINPF
jgi:outer membrane protein assembly factor BamD